MRTDAGRRPLAARLHHKGLALTTRLAVEPILGTPFLSLADEREQWVLQNESEREAWRAEALDRIVRYAVRCVPAYAGLEPRLDHFPVVDKQTMIDRPDEFLSTRRDEHRVVWKHTGGSTGDPWNYPLDRRAWAEGYATQIYRFREFGVEYGDPKLLLGFPTSLGLNHKSRIRRLRFAVERTDVSLASIEVDGTRSLERAVQACDRHVRMWYGYASTIASMAAAVLDAARTLSGPPLIVTMAEPLWPAWHRDIVDAFGSTVVEEYGANDGGIMAHRCEAGNLHLADHQSLVEVLDDEDRACPPGQPGAIVVTNFHARHMPFIRYRVGDIGIEGTLNCDCGRAGRTLTAVTGRSGDFVLLPDGTQLVPATFFLPFNQVEGVRRWQIVQPDPRSLVVRVEPRASFNADEKKTILSWVRQRSKDQLDVRLSDDEPFELTSGGKHRIVIRHF
ncbi:MAG: hypothetical protein OES24_03120 [Acidimicrobiia bacterium]|nr:hypothetical protein [Acidimicrobiia bacterium]